MNDVPRLFGAHFLRHSPQSLGCAAIGGGDAEIAAAMVTPFRALIEREGWAA